MNLFYMSNTEVNSLLNKATFKFAKTMPQYPHEYTLKETWDNKEYFVKCVKHIYINGIIESFYKTYNKYYYANGYKYWCYAMIDPMINNVVHWTEKKSIVRHNLIYYAENLCILINRVKI